jgi:uncharacterized protein YlxW (UPF0749 family)
VAPIDPFDRLANDLASLRVELQMLGVSSARLDQRIQALEKDVEQLSITGDTRYVAISRYTPVERVVYGVVGIIGTALIVALITLVIPRVGP